MKKTDFLEKNPDGEGDVPEEIESPVESAKKFLIAQAPINVAYLANLRDKAHAHHIKIRSIETMLRHTPGMTEEDSDHQRAVFNVNLLVTALTGERPGQKLPKPIDVTPIRTNESSKSP
jgi:hypothetical protein